MAVKKKILMIDDEADLCLLVKENLEATGEFEVITTTQPQDLKALCQVNKPDVILLDNVMPTIRGAEMVNVIKNNYETKDIPIVMISGKGEMVYSRKKGKFQWLPNTPAVRGRGEMIEGRDPEALAKVYGVADYVSKPFTTEVLIDVIKGVLAKI